MDYSCLVFEQRPGDADAPKFCMFHAPAVDIESWSTVPRLSPEDSSGIQRKKNDFKVKAIQKFLDQDSRNTIPTAIVLTFAANAYQLTTQANGRTTISIDPQKKASIFVVDGQHRLYGIMLFSQDAKIPVVAILDATSEERAFQFIVINNKVSKVTTDHIRALSINFADQTENPSLESRLKSARLSLSKNVQLVGQADELTESPFRGMVNLPGKADPQNRPVVAAAIEAGVAYIQSKKFKQLSEDESSFDFFLAAWSAIKQNWPQAFSTQSKLMSKVGMVTMTKYIADEITALSTYGGKTIDMLNSENVREAVQTILSLQTPEFWLREWTTTISDTKAVRDQIETALRTVQQNIKSEEKWNFELALVKNDAAA